MLELFFYLIKHIVFFWNGLTWTHYYDLKLDWDPPSATLGHVGGGGVGVVRGLVVPVGRVPLGLPAVVEAALVGTGGPPSPSAVARGASVCPSATAAGAAAL